MRHTVKRVAELELRAGRSLARHHVIHWWPGSGRTLDEAKDEYGREKIGPKDRVIVVPLARSALDS